MCSIINISIYSNFPHVFIHLWDYSPRDDIKYCVFAKKIHRKALIKNGIFIISVLFLVYLFSFPSSYIPFFHTFRNAPSALRSQIEYCCSLYNSCSLIDMIQMSAPRVVHAVSGIIGKSSMLNAFFAAIADKDKR